MRHIAIHDRHGTVVTLIAGPPDGPPGPVADLAGHEATEVDVEESGIDFSAFESEESAIKALTTLRVEVERKARLVRRDADESPRGA